MISNEPDIRVVKRIENLYLTILKRHPEQDEVDYWIEHGTILTNINIEGSLLDSIEMSQKLQYYGDYATGISFTVLTLFRDNEEYIPTYIQQFTDIQKIYGQSQFTFYLYENDSVDRTGQLLCDFISTQSENRTSLKTTSKIISEKLGLSSENGRTFSRVNKMSLYRNKLLDMGRPFMSDWTIITDTNIFIKDYTILGCMVEFADKHKDAVMIAANGVEIEQVISKHSMYPRKKKQKILKYISYHSYDTFAFKYNGNQYWHCLSKDCHKCPSGSGVYDLETEYLKVDAIFGGFIIVKSDILNKVNYNYVEHSTPTTDNLQGECEHVNFCEKVKEFGEIYLLPNLIVSWKG